MNWRIVGLRLPWVVLCPDCGDDVAIVITAEMARLVVCMRCGCEIEALVAFVRTP